MTALHFVDPSVQFLIILATTYGLNGANVQYGESINQPAVDSIHIQANHLKYLYPFQNCTTKIFTTKNFVWETIHKPLYGPIVFLSYDTKLNMIERGIDFRKFSMQMRRNFAPHCWATFTILPENEYLTRNRPHPDFISLKCFIDFNVWSQYFILVTAVPHVIQKYLKSELVLFRLSLREVIIVDVTHFVTNGLKLRMLYYNMYYIKSPTVGMEHSEPWYQIDCLPSDCFIQLTIVGQNVSRLNKYFWSTYSSYGGANMRNVRQLFGHADVGRIHHSTPEYRRLSNFTSFHGFLSFWILQDVIELNFTNYKPLHFIPPIQSLGPSGSRGLNLVIYDVHTHSYVSCYQVNSNSDILSTLTSPFDGVSWTLLITCFVTVVLLLTAVLCNCSAVSSDRVILMVGLTLESSVLASRAIYEAKFSQRKHESIGMYTIIAVWIILVGTILTNWYKSCFTIEMIVPRIYKSPWTSVMDVEGIRILVPFSFLDEYDSLTVHNAEYFVYLDFYSKLYFRFLHTSLENVTNQRLVAHKVIAKKLYNMLLPHFGLDENMTPVGHGIFSSSIGKPPPYNKSALQDYPIQPVEYGNRFEILKTLSGCGKVALMDSAENIATITNFLNDNQKRITYVKGDDDFFTEIRGWTFFPVRDSYAEERLKLMISSGIFAHWEFIYKLWKPKKLLNYYANWTHPKVEAVSRLDFDSKITAAFVLRAGYCYNNRWVQDIPCSNFTDSQNAWLHV
ncbi:hypothetical protein Fcan01_18005 [Folsomia candida]|uniref:Uncharacterized protein n=1 Tax=Folsomia candida TaxID=158441 RepID=A0A226DQR3_FOLCA|nr:hypothetical protein Fcan01_18005 [Folsomia candida]